ncbi:hypothetical protein V3C99_008152 [Haemonchus contortus]|uniref:RVT_N domain-containing protein n=1 Tax=Haemonchus contortus TaxID=6289 RepID=A0A7I4YM62_HAECO
MRVGGNRKHERSGSSRVGQENVGGEQDVNANVVRAQRALERTLLKINRAKQRSLNLRSANMRSMSGIRDAEKYAWNAKKRWAGHLVRRTDDRWTTRVTLWYSRAQCRLNAQLAVLQQDGVTR